VENLTPTARLTYDAIRDGGPGNVHELRERTGRSRSATDKALAELAKADLIVKVDDGGDPADGAPARWQVADTIAADGEAAAPIDETATGDGPAEATPDQPPGPADPAGASEAAHDGPTDPASDGDSPPAADAESGTTPATGDGQPGSDGDRTEQPGGDGDQAAEPEPPKLCRGCQAQMPKICECCWQKTPAYCGKCRRTMPQVRRGEPGEPQILSNGLPKLRPGELEELVAKVLREHPVPHHVGVTGWTGGRVAIFLPGRSTGAINNALEKLEKTGVAELIGDRPMRYQLKGSGPTDAEQSTDTSADADPDDTGSDGEQPAQAAEPPGEAAAPEADTTP
jgi:hypothetical protein